MATTPVIPKTQGNQNLLLLASVVPLPPSFAHPDIHSSVMDIVAPTIAAVLGNAAARGPLSVVPTDFVTIRPVIHLTSG